MRLCRPNIAKPAFLSGIFNLFIVEKWSLYKFLQLFSCPLPLNKKILPPGALALILPPEFIMDTYLII
jgi:hypothetical protein